MGAERMFGWTEAEMLGQPGAMIFAAADRQAGAPEREMRTAEKAGRAMDERWHVRKDGTAVWATGVMSLARDEAGKVEGFVKIMRDNTDQRETDRFERKVLR